MNDMRPLLLVNLICMAAIYAFVALASPLAHLLNLKAWHIGMLFGVVGLIWIGLAGAWGQVADRRGRVTTLRISMIGFTLAYLALAAYAWWALRQTPHATPAATLSLAVMLLTRGVMGGFYAGIPVAAMAWVADRTAHTERAPAMARLGAAGAIGMVLSPPLAGWVGRHDIALSLAVFALLPLFALPLLSRLKESRQPAAATQMARMNPGDRRIRRAWLATFAMYGSVIIANICLGFFLIDRLRVEARDSAAWVGAALGCAGLALIVAQTLVSRRPDVTPARWLRWGTLLGAAGFGSVLLFAHPLSICLGYFIAGFGLGMAFPATSALAANAVEAHEQGACAGAISVAQGLSMVVAPVIGTLVYQWREWAPFALIALVLVAVSLGRAPPSLPAHTDRR
ncbi:MFS transporter [Solilutibacter pythonis]|nr:MFS transporter [Lysobacter pythonis]